MIDIESLQKKLMEKEKHLDSILLESRRIIRACSNSIKAIHARDHKAADKFLDEAEAGIKSISSYSEQFPAQVTHMMQEYAEARIVLGAVKDREIPSAKKLGIEEIPYVLGLLDAIGELKREMYESLRKGSKEEAEQYFKMMEEIYDGLLPLRFSNAILPDFRRKQDAARHQIEQARGELL